MAKTCGKCDQIIKDSNYVQCDCCLETVHLHSNCSGLSSTESRAVAMQKRTILYFCENCRDNFKQVPLLIKKLGVLEREVDKLKHDVKELKAQNASLMEDMFNEINERATRASNIMVYNVKECESNILEEKINADKQIIGEIMHNMGLDNGNVLKVVRVGRPKGRSPKPVKVILASPSAASQVLKSRNKLKDTEHRIASDRTKLQQEQLKTAVTELNERNTNGEENLIIKYRKGVPVVEMREEKRNRKN